MYIIGLIRSLETHSISWRMLEYIYSASFVCLGVGLAIEMGSSASQVCRIIGACQSVQGSTINQGYFIEVGSIAGRPNKVYVLLKESPYLAGSRPG